MAQKVWRFSVSVLVHDLGYRGGNCICLRSNIGILLSTDNRYLFLLQRLTIPFDSLSLVLIQFSHAWRQSFVTVISDLFIFSPWFSISDNWASIFFDESPSRTILRRF